MCSMSAAGASKPLDPLHDASSPRRPCGHRTALADSGAAAGVWQLGGDAARNPVVKAADSLGIGTPESLFFFTRESVMRNALRCCCFGGGGRSALLSHASHTGADGARWQRSLCGLPGGGPSQGRKSDRVPRTEFAFSC